MNPGVDHYIYPKPQSLRARLTALAIRLSGARKSDPEKAQRIVDAVSEPAPIPRSLKRRHRVTESTVAGKKLWTIIPRARASEQVILYLHGGAYVVNLLSVHWKLIEQLAERTGATVVVPDYPLASQATCVDVMAYLTELMPVFNETRQGRPWTIMGDSAGGGLSYAWAQHLRDHGLEEPDQIVLLSPWLDVRMNDPAQDSIDQLDPLLSRPNARLAGVAYAGALPLLDPRVSPLFGEHTHLAPVAVFTGTHDVVNADAHSLRAVLIEEGIDIGFYEYPKMFHVFMALTFLPEARNAIEQIAALVRQAGR